MRTRRGAPAVVLLGLLALGAAVAGGCGAVSGPSNYGWAEAWERERCIRDGNWWRPNDRVDGLGRCDKVNMER